MNKPRVPYLDLRLTDLSKRQELMDAIENVLSHGKVILGPEVKDFEKKIAIACARESAIGVGSGTDALILSLKALGLAAGDEIITTPACYVATANAISLVGATAVFADINDDMNISVRTIEPLITNRTRAVLAVDLTGQMSDLDKLEKISNDHSLFLIEDFSQAFAAKLGSRPAGSYGVVACLSLNPMKTLAASGEAGIIVTDQLNLAEEISALRHNGLINGESCIRPSHNARLDTIQAAILLCRLRWFPEIVERRTEIAHYYNEQLKGVLKTPLPGREKTHTWYSYQIRTEKRDGLKSFLEENGIEVKIHYLNLLPEHPAHSHRVLGAFPNAQRINRQTLSLPCHENMSDIDVEYVAKTVLSYFVS